MPKFLKGLYYSFPVQLVFLHLKRHQILLIFWVLLFLVATGHFGKEYGIPYLMLDPEYRGLVDSFSFGILGAAFGGFLMTWNISTYILESSRFKFLATFERPFAIYSLNNGIIPLAFVITYVIFMVRFQSLNEFTQPMDIMVDLGGFLGGMFIIIFIAAIYFQTTNRNIFNIFKLPNKPIKQIKKRVTMREDMRWEEVQGLQKEFRVDYYLSMTLRPRIIRSVTHYSEKMLREVFRQNHLNAFFIQSITLLSVLGMGFLMDNSWFRIPAAASGILFFAILTALAGMLDFWFKGWKALVIILLIAGLNFIVTRYDIENFKNKAYGLDYSEPKAEYSYASLNDIGSIEKIHRDRLNTIAILEAWKEHTGEERPKLVLMNFSGGGLSSAMFSTAVIQQLDSATDGQLFKHTVLMTGASGGMIGASYLREIYLQQLQKKISNPYDPVYVKNISKDLLNSTIFAFVSNDIYFPVQKFKYAGESYHKDRGYLFEQQLNENTDNFLNHTIGYYDQYEKAGLIPIMIFAPTIINDQRQMYICAQPVSYLMRPIGKNFIPHHTDVDGVDFMGLFAGHQPDSLRISSAVRMNATYPYVLPYATMPTEPMIKVMDAGFRDNYGLGTTAKFVNTFKDWIKANTSGVIVLQVRQYTKERKIPDYRDETIISDLFSPLSSVYGNLSAVQDYDQSYLMSSINDALNGQVNIITFQYTPEAHEDETSLSFHLTTREQELIKIRSQGEYIADNLEELKSLLKVGSPQLK